MVTKQSYQAVIASGGTSGDVDLGTAGYQRVYLRHTAGAAVDVYGSHDGSTYAQMALASGVAANWANMRVGSAQSGLYVELPPLPRYVRVVATAAVGDGTTVRIITA